MSKQSNNKSFIERMNQYDSPMDFDAAWESLEQSRKKKKRGGFIYWYLIGAGFILAVSVLFYYQKNIDTNHYSAKIKAQATSKKIINHPVPAELTAPKTKTLDEPQISTIKNELNQFSQKTNKKEKTIATSFNSYSSHNEKLTKSTKPTTSFDKNLQSTIAPTKNIQNTNTASIENAKSVSKELIADKKTKQVILQQSPLINNLSFIANSANKPENSIAIKNYPGPSKNKWSISFATGYAVTDKQIIAGSTSTQDYAAFRANNETGLDLITSELSIQRQLNDYFSLASGIRFQNFTDRFTDQYQTTSPQLFEDQVIEIITLRDGTEEKVLGAVEGTVDSTFSITRYNTTQQISIPLEIGVRIPINGQLYSTLSGGLAVGIFNQSKGIIYNEQLQIGQYELLSDISESSLSLSQANLSIGLGWQFARNWAIESQIYGGTHLNGIKNNKNNLKEKYKWMGINLGIRFNW